MSGTEQVGGTEQAGGAVSGVEELVAAVRAGRTTEVPALVAALDPARRRACLPELQALRKQERTEGWNRNLSQLNALLVAGAGCHVGPAGAATWIASRSFSSAGLSHPALFELFDGQSEEWQVDVATRLAARRGSAWAWGYFELVDRVFRRTGCAVPASEAYLREWLNRMTWQNRRSKGPYGTLIKRLRADSLTPVLVPRIFELADADALDDTYRGPEDSWPLVLAELAATGELDRAELIDLTVARLLRGGRAADQRIFLTVLNALAPTPEEYAARSRDLLALLDGVSTVADHAQRTLGELDEAGLIEPEALVEGSATVLFRSEKKLVRAQLGLLDKAARRTPERAGALVLAAAEAFGHPDAALQERALNLVARHLKRAGDAVLPDLRSAAEQLSPAHHARAAELLGAPVGGEEADQVWAELLPPAPQPVLLGEPIATPAEVAEELNALRAQDEPGVAEFERVLDGLVRHTHRDRAALAAALLTVLEPHHWDEHHRWTDCGPGDVRYVAAAVVGERLPAYQLWGFLAGSGNHSPLRGRNLTGYGEVLAARLEEAIRQVALDRPEECPPLLLATPTDATGALAAADLVERIAVHEAAGTTPGEADLSAALLRLTPTTDPDTLAAADRLGSPAGRWVAHWLRGGGPAPVGSERVAFEPKPEKKRPVQGRYLPRWWEALRRIAVATPARGTDPVGPAGERLRPEFARLLDGTEPSVARLRNADELRWQATAHWVAMLPHHREELAARWMDWFAAGADLDSRGSAQRLPQLAEAGGPAGLALHLALAYSLGARYAEDRTAAVDALLVLAARGELDGALLGRELAELVALGTVKPNRLALGLAAAAETGAYGTVWSVLGAALPGLLTGEPARGLGELVAIAADCARRSGARGPIEQVTAVASGPGSNRLVKEARGLREVLGA